MSKKSKKLLKYMLNEHLELFQCVEEINNIEIAAEALIKALEAKNKILICGNGGSAADAQHFAAELIGRFERNREPLPAIALTTDCSILTAVGNDFGYDAVFEKQVKALGSKGDVLVGISTSGNSPNVMLAVEAAKRKKMICIGLLGKDGGRLKRLVSISVIAPHRVVARIQEVHLFILHYWAAVIERHFIRS